MPPSHPWEINIVQGDEPLSFDQGGPTVGRPQLSKAGGVCVVDDLPGCVLIKNFKDSPSKSFVLCHYNCQVLNSDPTEYGSMTDGSYSSHPRWISLRTRPLNVKFKGEIGIDCDSCTSNGYPRTPLALP